MTDDQLDVNSPRGQLSKLDQETAAAIVFTPTGFSYAFTPTHKAAPIEGVFFKDSIIHGLFEVKGRNCDLIKLATQYKWEWLLSFDKLQNMAKASALFQVPGYGLLYLRPANTTIVTRLTDQSGQIICQYHLDRTFTPATCNGGSAHRINAFINVQNSSRFNGTRKMLLTAPG